MLYIIIILIIAVAVLITLYLMLSREVKNISSQLKEHNEGKTNSKILLSFSNKALEDLAQSMNKSLEEKQSLEIEYKRMDKELRQAIANMSHDLRTPLTSIMGYMQLIEDDSTKVEDKKQYLDIVKRRAATLQGLIESFYDMSRLEAREYKLELKPINLSSIMCDMIAAFYNDFINRQIEPIIEIEENTPMIIGDENGVKRVIANLIQNMLRYGSKHIRIYLIREKNTLLSVFENDAQGLTPEDVPHLFERFFTADQARSGKSTGLGLAITKQLVEQMGHSIRAEFKDGRLGLIIEWKA